MFVIDFETYGIMPRPEYPPKPVGVSIAKLGVSPTYYSWGHLTGANNSTFSEVRQLLLEIWKTGQPLIFHHAKFDLDVWAEWFNMPYVADYKHWRRIHDTMILLFLDDPNQQQLGLKPSSERLLNMPPEERNTMCDWLVTNQPVKGVKISSSPSTDTTFNKYIPYAPVEIVAPYANGDVTRTAGIFEKTYTKVCHTMPEAYDRERKLLLILLDIERQGVRLDAVKLEECVRTYQERYTLISTWITSRLNNPEEFNLDSGRKLLTALRCANLIDMSKVGVTPKGNFKSDQATLLHAVTDKQLASSIAYYKKIGTSLKTFLKPWLLTSKKTGGIVSATWHQTKSGETKKTVGARTGRLSSTPNFQNIPTKFKPLFCEWGDVDTELPKMPLPNMNEMPNIRGLVVPYQDDHVLIDMDWQQQELRLLAHYENDVLLRAYKKDANLDVHTYAKELILNMTGRDFSRKVIKGVGFGLLYGMGKTTLAKNCGISEDEAVLVKQAYLNIFPGLQKLNDELRERALSGVPLRTWGGRIYLCEKPKIIKGKHRTFEYKMINTLIQGSAADCLKQAIINYYDTKPPEHKLLLTVHDEILISVPKNEEEQGAKILKKAMESLPLDIPLLTDMKRGGSTWN